MKSKPIIVDAHQDIAWNILTLNRDYSQIVAETRSREVGTQAPIVNGDTLLGWDAYQNGRIAVVFSTLFAAPIRSKKGDWEILCYTDEEEAYRLYHNQAETYHHFVEQNPEKFTLVQTRRELDSVLKKWEGTSDGETAPVGLVLLIEGAECVRTLDDLAEWWQLGVRIIGLAWWKTRFCGGTGEPGPLTQAGYQLLDGMAEYGFSLDISHMDEEAVLQALDHFP
jgi:membrane dipeptidase